MKEKQKKYNAADFARYHSGEMPPGEMHALEKAALKDPFLADALDGYAFSKNPETELDEIKMQLIKKKERNNVFSLHSLSPGAWWKIAAMFILIAGAGYFFFKINSQNEHSLAVTEKQAKEKDSSIISALKKDTASPEGNMVFEKTSPQKEKNNSSKLSAPSVKSFSHAVEEGQHTEKRMREEKIQTNEKSEIMAMSAEKMKAADIALSDSGGKNFLHSSDTTALVAVSPNVYLNDTDKAVAMNKKNASLNEVVITGFGKKRNKNIANSTSQELQGKIIDVEITSSTPYPKEGKEKFDQYITDNAIREYDSTGERIHANILLSFTLDKKGKPSNIKVLESSCKACEEEAIRLLKEGPDWAGKKGTKATVRIQF